MGASSHPHHHYFHPPTSPINFDHHQLHPSSTQHRQQWPALSRPPVSPLVARLLASSSPPRPLASPPRLLVVSRSLTATSLVPSLFVRSVATRRALSSSSASSASSPLPSAPSRSRSSLTSSPSSRTPTSAPSTPS